MKGRQTKDEQATRLIRKHEGYEIEEMGKTIFSGEENEKYSGRIGCLRWNSYG